MGDDGRETLCAVRFDDEICSLFPEMLFPRISESDGREMVSQDNPNRKNSKVHTPE